MSPGKCGRRIEPHARSISGFSPRHWTVSI
jgi:hypothetical protein